MRVSDGNVDPLRAIDVINTELVLVDIQMLENRIARLDKQAKGDRKVQSLLDMAKKLLEHLNVQTALQKRDRLDTI